MPGTFSTAPSARIPAALIPSGFSLFREDLEHVAARLRQPELLRNAHILMTGGSGFVGIWLTETLLWLSRAHDLNLHLTLLSRQPQLFLQRHPYLREHANLHFIQGDLSHTPELDTLTRALRVQPGFTHYIHGASLNLDGQAHWAQRHMATDIDGTRCVLGAAAENQAPVLILSSGGVYTMPFARHTQGRWGEEIQSPAEYQAWQPVYGLGKRVMESLAVAAGEAGGFRTPIARAFAFIAPWLKLNSNFAAGNFIRDALAGKKIVILGDGTPQRSYLYGSDMALWLLQLLLHGRSRPYNVGGERAVSIAELARISAQTAGLPVDFVEIRGKEPDANPQPAYLPDIELAKQELGLAVHVDIEKAVSSTLEWYKLDNRKRIWE